MHGITPPATRLATVDGAAPASRPGMALLPCARNRSADALATDGDDEADEQMATLTHR